MLNNWADSSNNYAGSFYLIINSTHIITSQKLNSMKHYTSHNASVLINPKKGFRIHLLVFLLVIPVIWFIWYLTDSSYPWPVWQSLAWGTGVLFHYLGVFVFKKHRLSHQR